LVVVVHLVDTSVFTRLHHPSVRKELDALAPEELARSSVTDLELGFSARNGTEWDTGAEMLDAFTELPLSEDILGRAREIQRMLADRGLRGRKVPDLLIAATAEAGGAVLVHYDHDFELIATVTGQPAQWIVRRGSID
jgi:predicted nucleic acid-binding protein